MSLNLSKKLSGASWQKTEVPLFPKVSVASTFVQRARGLLRYATKTRAAHDSALPQHPHLRYALPHPYRILR